jgi:hypothetical protein
MYGHNPGHITRGDPVMRTRRLIQKDIEALEQELSIIDDADERSCLIVDLYELKLDLAAVIELERV